jgi:Ca2+-binding RTX toxin-like protein
VVGAALALPATVQATTVSLAFVELGTRVDIIDGSGVADSLVASGSTTAGVTVTSTGRPTGRPITAGAGCVQTSATVVSCPAAQLMSATLAGGSDSVTNRTNLVASVDGGPDNDRLTAGFGTNTLEGGPGDDVLLNGENAAADNIVRTISLLGEEGDDLFDLSGNRQGPDTARGGLGFDTATYSRRLDQAVTVTLDNTANDGSRPTKTSSENDDVRLENVTGGGQGDSLTGSATANVLSGGAGNDSLLGLAGPDTLLGGPGNDIERGGGGGDLIGALEAGDAAAQDPGRDTLEGADGFDFLHAADGVSDARIDCGPPTTEIGEVATIDLTPQEPQPVGCEVVQEGAKDQHPLVQVRRGSGRVRNRLVAVRLSCPRAAPGRRCAGRVRVVKSGRTLAGGRYRIRKGRRRTVRLRLRLRARGRAQVLTRERDTRGEPETTRTLIRLRG